MAAQRFHNSSLGKQSSRGLDKFNKQLTSIKKMLFLLNLSIMFLIFPFVKYSHGKIGILL